MEGFKKILQFVRTRMPIICTVIFGLCWIAYLINCGVHKGGIDNQPDSFWITMRVIIYTMFVNSGLFVISFSALMLVKPLPEKYKVLRFILRLVIAAVVSVFFLGCTYLSAGCFVGFGG